MSEYYYVRTNLLWKHYDYFGHVIGKLNDVHILFLEITGMSILWFLEGGHRIWTFLEGRHFLRLYHFVSLSWTGNDGDATFAWARTQCDLWRGMSWDSSAAVTAIIVTRRLIHSAGIVSRQHSRRIHKRLKTSEGHHRALLPPESRASPV